jgi:hypothetical protein
MSLYFVERTYHSNRVVEYESNHCLDTNFVSSLEERSCSPSITA